MELGDQFGKGRVGVKRVLLRGFGRCTKFACVWMAALDGLCRECRRRRRVALAL